MTPDEGGQGLLALLAHGLVRHAYRQTRETLGDRSRYVGLSDVGKGLFCLRAAVADKLGSTSDHPDTVPGLVKTGDWTTLSSLLNRQLVLQRGHWLESGVEAAYQAAGQAYVAQLEIAPDGPVPIRAHLDFVLFRPGARPAVRIVELKSTKTIPDSLYSAHEAQLYGQLGLLARHWRDPVFSLQRTDGTRTEKMSFPEIVHQSVGLSLPMDPDAVTLDGFVLCLSMTEGKAFGPYRPSVSMTALVEKTAVRIWEGVRNVRSGSLRLDDLPICPGFHPLCDFCPHTLGCPKFSGISLNDPGLDSDLDRLRDMKQQRDDLAARIDLAEERIRAYCRHADSDTGWLKTARYRFKLTRMAGRSSLDSEQLRHLLSAHLDAKTIDSVLTRSRRSGAGSERLYVASNKAPLSQPDRSLPN